MKPEPGWFWTDWWVKMWLDAPAEILGILATLILIVCLTYSIFERLDVGAAAWLFGLQTVDEDGHPPSWTQTGLRCLGNIVCFCSLGLGFFGRWPVAIDARGPTSFLEPASLGPISVRPCILRIFRARRCIQ
ncbi:MAG: hypothetical protein R3E66_20350 [bacterium]